MRSTSLGLDFAVVTAVARDDLADGGAAAFAATIDAIRSARPGCRVEVLIPDCKGDPAALATIFDARPDVLNHNIETVARLQRAARPSAGYARSLAVLARAADAGLVTKSGMVLGMGETEAEIASTLADLAGVGVSIVTMGQYLRPTAAHLPVARWWTPEDFERFAEMAQGGRHRPRRVIAIHAQLTSRRRGGRRCPADDLPSGEGYGVPGTDNPHRVPARCARARSRAPRTAATI